MGPASVRPFGEWFRNGYKTEEEAFGIYKKKLTAFFSQRRDNPDDLTSETFLVALRMYGPETPEKYDHPVKFLFGIAKNLAMRYESMKTVSLEEQVEWVVTERPERASDQLSKCVAECLMKLADDERELLERYKFEEDARSVIAAGLGIAPGALRTKVCRVKNELQNMVRECMTRLRRGSNNPVH